MKALVTGAGGFLGQYLVEKLLARGDQVRVVVRRDYAPLHGLPIEVVRSDLTNHNSVVEACRGVDVVFHAAAKSGIWGSWQSYFQNNVAATKYLLEGCQTHQVRRMVFTSSPSVTFNGADQEGIDESIDYPRRWLCHYAHSKALAEQAVLRANGTDHLATCALRPHLIWGPHDPQLIPRLFNRAETGKLIQVGDGSNQIDTVYVENAADAHLAAADALDSPESKPAGSAYFLSQGEPIGCWDWINRLLAIGDMPPVKRSISLKLAYHMGATLETAYRLLRKKSEPPMTRFLALQLGRSHFFNISRAKNDFGYQPTVSTEEGLRRLKASL
jgi:2-alkyl-3-oxoalkanoate reductase